MEINDRFRRIIFKKLANDLSHVEIIPYEDSIWFIDRDKKYWYLELENDEELWWRLDFFERFFKAFSLQRDDYELLIKEWVERVLNQKVNTILPTRAQHPPRVERVLNQKVDTTAAYPSSRIPMVEKVLNSN